MVAVNRIRPQSRRFILTKVGECLYRSEAGSYFAVVKHQGKQHRKCLQTKDRSIAAKTLGKFRPKLRGLVLTAPALYARHRLTVVRLCRTLRHAYRKVPAQGTEDIASRG